MKMPNQVYYEESRIARTKFKKMIYKKERKVKIYQKNMLKNHRQAYRKYHIIEKRKERRARGNGKQKKQ